MSQETTAAGQLHSREQTLATVIEAIDTDAPGTKEELAEAVELSPNYISEVLQELKSKGMVRKAYVVDDGAIFEQVEDISQLWQSAVDAETQPTDALFDLFERLNQVTLKQYRAARAAFCGDRVAESADQLEPLANERYSAVLSELRSYTITTEWPGNRIAAALATIAVNLEIAGDRACLIADAVKNADSEPTGAVHERAVEIFAAGEQINEHVKAILFDRELGMLETLHATERTVHRDLEELFELVTAYDPDTYGYLVTVTRTLERIIHYWVSTAETAVQVHTGVDPGHVGL